MASSAGSRSPTAPACRWPMSAGQGGSFGWPPAGNVRHLFDAATARGAPLSGWHGFRYLRRILNWAIRRGLIEIDWITAIGREELCAERLLQVIAARAARAAVIVTADLPFSERGQVFLNPRPGQVLVDRRTDRADIIETGTGRAAFAGHVQAAETWHEPPTAAWTNMRAQRRPWLVDVAKKIIGHTSIKVLRFIWIISCSMK